MKRTRAMGVAEGEVQREAKRVLPRLSTEGAYVAPLLDGHHTGPSAAEFKPDYGVFVKKNHWRKPVIRTKGKIIEMLWRKELLCWICGAGTASADENVGDVRLSSGRLRLSPLGYKFLERLRGPDADFQAQHRISGVRHIRSTKTANTSFVVNLGESPLGWLLKRKRADGYPLITQFEYEAGERLREDFTKAQMMPQITSVWAASSGSKKRRRGPCEGTAVSDSALAAKQRFEKALLAVGPGLSDILIETCCFLNGLEQVERSLGWPRRSGKVVLEIALARLAGFYNLVPGNCPHPRYQKE